MIMVQSCTFIDNCPYTGYNAVIIFIKEKIKMKRIGCVLLGLLMILSLSACGGEEKKEPDFVETLNQVVVSFTEDNSPQYKTETEYNMEKNLYIITVKLNEEEMEQLVKESMTEEELAQEGMLDYVVNHMINESEKNEDLINATIQMYENLVNSMVFEQEFDCEVRYEKVDGTIVSN